jgi:predicted  nucleic acid-binding Zn-ribbon protein
MPHECTDCGRAFDDGSKEMLSGCPDCGGNTFQFRPDGVDADDPGEPDDATTPPEPEVGGTVARTVGNAATTVRDFVGGNDSPGYPEDTPDPEPSVSGRDAPSDSPPAKQEPSMEASASGGITADTTSQEDAAQASARSEVVSSDDLPESPDGAVRERPAPVVDESSEQSAQDRPDLDELREQLNEQFESIRVVAPGQYELNLMELYDREEYIIALQEDGKYTIQVPERWSE